MNTLDSRRSVASPTPVSYTHLDVYKRQGFAMGAAGTDTAIETADVALMDDDLRKIPAFVRLSRQTHAILLQNIVLALGIKAIFLALTPVSYTHLDVYKRQIRCSSLIAWAR